MQVLSIPFTPYETQDRMKNNSSSIVAYRILFWPLLVLAAMAAAMTTQPSQYYFGWTLAAALVPIAFVQSPDRFFLRVLFLLLGAFITMRYLLFRTAYTLYFDDRLNFALALVLFLAECYAITVHFFGIFVSLNPKSRSTPPLPEKLPSIDVFIPTYSEDVSVALTTALACKNFEYPSHLVNVYILDDGCRLPRLNNKELRPALLQRHRELSRKAREAGVVYLTREDGEQAKAGMINAAFLGRAFSSPELDAAGDYRAGERVRTNGDLVLILDCDHIPTRDMPAKVVGHFSDPQLFMAQTPHFMLNADPVRKNLNNDVRLPCESWLFYRNMQRGLDRWNAAFFCGSAAFLRRSMLEETGGLSGDTITEDCETSLALHAKGYSSVYVETPLVAGLAPESFSDMIQQRRRWCQGMLQILLLKNPLLLRGLTLAQRFSYINNCLFWLFPLARIVFLLAPLMFLLFNINIYNASIEQVIAFAGPHIFASLLLAVRIHGKLRPFLYSEVLETLQSFFLLPAIASVAAAPRKPVFLTTRKGVTQDRDALSPLAWPFFLLLFLFLLGFALGLRTWVQDPPLRDTIYITFFWNSYNFLILICCLGAVWERKQRRAAHRVRTAENVTLGGVPAVLDNLSLSGVGLTLHGGDFQPGREYPFSASIPGSPQADGRHFNASVRLVRVEGARAAGAFTDTADQRALIDYVYGDSRRWQDVMDDVLLRHGGYVRQSFALQAAGIRSALAALGGAVRKLFFPLLLSAVIFQPCLEARAEILERPLSALVKEERFLVRSAEGELRVPFYLSARSVLERAELTIVYQRSGRFPKGQRPLSAIIDEQAAEVSALSEGPEDSRVTFLLPREKLIPGTRLVSLRVEQRLPEAGTSPETEMLADADAGEFWTAVDLRRSTLSLVYTLRPLTEEERGDFRFIFNDQALPPKSVHFVVPDLTESNVMRAFKAMQPIALALGERPMLITASALVEEGKDCVIIGDESKTLRAASPPSPSHVRLTEEDILPFAKGKRYVLDMNTTQTFQDLGLGTLAFNPRSAERASKFLIPTPTYLNPNRPLTVSLDLAYSSGLHKDSRLEVGVNEEVLTWVRLDNPEGSLARSYRVDVPATLLQKGFNRLHVRPVLLPASGMRWTNSEEDLSVTVFSSSSLTLPDTGTYVRIPELGTIFTDGYPFSGDGIMHLPHPTYDTIASAMNLMAFIVQHRGTLSGKAGFSFEPWRPDARNAIEFALDPAVPDKSILLKVSLVPGSRDKVGLFLRASSDKDLLRGIQALWNDDVHEKLHGVEALLRYTDGAVSQKEGETRIISDIGLLPVAAYYANNHPFMAAAGFVLLLLVFACSVYGLTRNVNK